MSVDSEVQTQPRSQDWGLQRAGGWELKFCWIPEYCFLTGKSLWGKRAYRGENWITGPGLPIVEYFWIEKHEFLIWNLRGRK